MPFIPPRSLYGASLGDLNDVDDSDTTDGKVLTRQADGSFALEAAGGGGGGSVVRSGSGVPSGGLGVDGDFYINTAANTLYGPKASGSWGSAVSLVGPTGATGATGPTGPTGPTGTAGPGVATGGTAGQVLSKVDATDFNTTWIAAPVPYSGATGSVDLGAQAFACGAITCTTLTPLNANVQQDRYGSSTSSYRFRKANGTQGSPTQAVSGDNLGFFGAYGYHSGGAFHTTAAAFVSFFAEENFTATAQGASVRISTVPTGSTSSAVRVWVAASGEVGIGTTSAPTTKLDVNGDLFRLRTAKTPSSSSATGNAGEFCWDSTYLYICTATNTWKRVAWSTF